MLGALYVSRPCPVLALELVAALVPSGVVMTPAAANSPSSNAAGWPAGYVQAGNTRTPARHRRCRPLPQPENDPPIIVIMSVGT